MKRIFSITALAAICILFFFAMPVCANRERRHVVDEAEIISNDEELQERLLSISDKYDMDIVVITVDSLGSKTATEFADDYYDYNGYSDDGILFLLSMEKRDWAISTKGKGIKVFTDSRQADIISAMKYDLSKDNFDSGLTVFVDKCEEILQNTQRTRYIIIFGTATAVGLIAALITVFAMKSQLKSVKYEKSANSYLNNNSVHITQNSDIFLYKTLNKTKRESSSSSSGGSSTHRSSSGSTHGGSSGKF